MFFAASKQIKQNRGDSGHSFRDTPGLIPNPEVKPEHVVCCTEVRESPGTIPSCYHLPSYTVTPKSGAFQEIVILSVMGKHQVRDLHDT